MGFTARNIKKIMKLIKTKDESRKYDLLLSAEEAIMFGGLLEWLRKATPFNEKQNAIIETFISNAKKVYGPEKEKWLDSLYKDIQSGTDFFNNKI